jgi:hypothetical protein
MSLSPLYYKQSSLALHYLSIDVTVILLLSWLMNPLIFLTDEPINIQCSILDSTAAAYLSICLPCTVKYFICLHTTLTSRDQVTAHHTNQRTFLVGSDPHRWADTSSWAAAILVCMQITVTMIWPLESEIVVEVLPSIPIVVEGMESLWVG